MKIRRKKQPKEEIKNALIGTVFVFTKGVYNVGGSEPCMRVPYVKSVREQTIWENPVRCVSLVTGKLITVEGHFEIQELDVELHVLGDLP